jgi:hypothetical protein
MQGAASVLRKYCQQLVSHVNNVLTSAVSVASMGSRFFCLASNIIAKDITGRWPYSSLELKINKM